MTATHCPRPGCSWDDLPLSKITDVANIPGYTLPAYVCPKCGSWRVLTYAGVNMGSGCPCREVSFPHDHVERARRFVKHHNHEAKLIARSSD